MPKSDSPGEERGLLALVLHAHLPYVRHPEHEDSLEENWLYEAITETYVPLFLVLEDLLADGVDFRLTFSVTPTLSLMLGDQFLQSRYLRRLERQMELADKEVARTASDAMFGPLARMYRTLFTRVHEAFVGRYEKNLLNAFRRFQDLGKVELIASAATHGYLPLLSVDEAAVRTQVRVGVEHHRQTFGRQPNGFWLPECGYVPGVDQFLAEQGIRFSILETHGITRASERPRYGVHAPLYCPSGVAVFGRDPDCSRQVWSSVDGYPGDFDYREFYRDIGYDLDADYIKPYIHPDGIRIDTGFKYYRITSKGEHKEPYVPEWAERKAEMHAGHFLSERVKQVERLSGMMDRKPLIVAPYDAELFGHWWFEGPRWLEYLIRKTALEQDTVRLVTLSEYLERYPVNQAATPSMSSWGDKGFSEVWLNQRNQWIYPHLHEAAEDLRQMAAARPGAEGLMYRALNQAARELLLAQASDWAFMINSGAMEQYAGARTRGHLLRFHRIREQVESGSINEPWLEPIEARDNVFPGMNVFQDFCSPDRLGSAATSSYAAHAAVRTRSAPIHVVMVSPEAMPFAKTGGLADMVTSLSAALEELGVRVSVIVPGYRQALGQGLSLRDTGIRAAVPCGGRTEEAQVLVGEIGSRIPVYLVRADRYFGREYLYGTSAGDYADNAERFAFFSRAALEVLRQIDPPDVLHAHDWQAALAITFLKTQPERYPGLAAVRTVLTVHNPGYQGLFPDQEWGHLGLDRGLYTPDGLEFHGRINLLKGGVLFADAVTTVSPAYAQEILTAEQGFGMEGVFARRQAALTGILNGADYGVWNPATDRFLASNYGPEDLSGKQKCKTDLQRTFGLPRSSGIPLVGMVSRLAAQKGFDLLEKVLDELLERNLQLVILGSGDRRYQDFFRSAARRHPRKLAVRIAFDEALAHKIEAGAGLFLMPSRYEPSGLSQFYSMKYGTIPVVRATGGLKDSIDEFDPVRGTGNGFTFSGYEGAALLEALDRALAAFARKDCWNVLMKNAMAADHSWSRSAREYVRLYEKLLGINVTGTRSAIPPAN
jgi:1,4-alpha-glucan branching enzyme